MSRAIDTVPLLLLVGGCHRPTDPGIDAAGWIVIGLGVAYLLLIAWIDHWRKELGYRVEPAPYVNMSEPTKIVQKSEGQQAGEPK